MVRRSATLAIALVLAGCSGGSRGFTFENQSGVKVTIVSETADGETVDVTELAPGTSALIIGWPGPTCADMTMIARGPDGAEVARREGRACLDDTWQVARPGPSN